MDAGVKVGVGAGVGSEVGAGVGTGDAHAHAASAKSAPAAKTRSRKTMIALIADPPLRWAAPCLTMIAYIHPDPSIGARQSIPRQNTGQIH